MSARSVRATRLWVAVFLLLAVINVAHAVVLVTRHGDWLLYAELAVAHLLIAHLWWLADAYQRRLAAWDRLARRLIAEATR